MIVIIGLSSFYYNYFHVQFQSTEMNQWAEMNGQKNTSVATSIQVANTHTSASAPTSSTIDKFNDENNDNKGDQLIPTKIDSNDNGINTGDSDNAIAFADAAISTTTNTTYLNLQRDIEDKIEGKREKVENQSKQIEQDEIKEKSQQEAGQEELKTDDNNNSTSTVIGLPSQNESSDPIIFKRFVGSLRKTGFGGNIIIGVDSTVGEVVVDYLEEMRVTIKYLTPVKCTFEAVKNNETNCYHPYSHTKREWSYFPLVRDWLRSCDACTDSVVVASVKDTVFQLNPFGKGMPIISTLQLYEQHPNIIAAQTTVSVLKTCDKIDLDKINKNNFHPTMDLSNPRRISILSPGTAVGPRDDVIDYLDAFHTVTKEWTNFSECHPKHSKSDDGTAVVNYLQVKQRLPHGTRIISYRTGIVNNIGYEGRNAYEAHLYFWEFKGLTSEEASKMTYRGAKGEGWIDTDYKITDADGQFIDALFQKSAIVYEYNAFGTPFTDWFDTRLGLSSSASMDVDDTAPPSTNEGGDGTEKEQLDPHLVPTVIIAGTQKGVS